MSLLLAVGCHNKHACYRCANNSAPYQEYSSVCDDVNLNYFQNTGYTCYQEAQRAVTDDLLTIPATRPTRREAAEDTPSSSNVPGDGRSSVDVTSGRR